MRPLKISRDHLITCAGNELMRVGAGRVTVDRVAADASCAKGLLHYHFSSKDGLLSEARSRPLDNGESTTGPKPWRPASRTQ